MICSTDCMGAKMSEQMNHEDQIGLHLFERFGARVSWLP